ncbi:type II secretion system protein J [Maribacter sp. 2210JD10-5]|uniref:PulJ/GspJ family protein n=1 Tax=Maribacter sp. 2210JD10-5 TaxID=3386272 RepID=UPI0039BD7784
MSIKTKKVRAFTLSEMIVVLLLTAIVVGISFSVLNLVQRQMGSIENIYEVKSEANNLRQSLWMDFSTHSYIFYDAKNKQLNVSNELGSKQYAFTGNLLIKEKDTFNIKVESLQFYFDNEPIEHGELDAIELVTSKETGNQRIFVYKDNSTATYMNRNK